jgi:cytochrome oxidase assembly protein ShyY1
VLRLDRDAIAEQMPYPIAPYQLILLDDAVAQRTPGVGNASGGALGTSTRDSTRPVRIPLPALDEGPHKSYAMQWFAFAAIALIGTALVTRSEWQSRRDNPPHRPEKA